jgi:hypothetical protein
MGTDTKLGMVVGVVAVLAVAIIYFPKTAPSDRTTAVVPSITRGAETALLPAHR